MTRRWNTLRALQYGALVGLAYGLYLVASSWHQDGDHTLRTVGLPLGGAIYGAALFVAASKIRNLVGRMR